MRQWGGGGRPGHTASSCPGPTESRWSPKASRNHAQAALLAAALVRTGARPPGAARRGARHVHLHIGTLLHRATWMDLENTMPRERSQTWKAMHNDFVHGRRLQGQIQTRGARKPGRRGLGGEGRRARLLRENRLPSRWPKCLWARCPHRQPPSCAHLSV